MILLLVSLSQFYVRAISLTDLALPLYLVPVCPSFPPFFFPLRFLSLEIFSGSVPLRHPSVGLIFFAPRGLWVVDLILPPFRPPPSLWGVLGFFS